MNEVKNMLDYEVVHYVHDKNLTSNRKKNVLRIFMFLKLKYFQNRDIEKLKAKHDYLRFSLT